MVNDAAIDALAIIADPWRFMFVAFGTLLGSIPGVGPNMWARRWPICADRPMRRGGAA